MYPFLAAQIFYGTKTTWVVAEFGFPQRFVISEITVTQFSSIQASCVYVALHICTEPRFVSPVALRRVFQWTYQFPDLLPKMVPQWWVWEFDNWSQKRPPNDIWWGREQHSDAPKSLYEDSREVKTAWIFLLTVSSKMLNTIDFHNIISCNVCPSVENCLIQHSQSSM